jgi:methylated-DNA-[protein]-cysteine S-methyltransferase
MMTLRSTYLATPIGTVEIAGTEKGLTQLRFVDAAGKSDAPYAYLSDAEKQLAEYFAGKRRNFTDLPLAIVGTAFHQDVWDQVSRVPYGSTLTYGQVASLLHKDGAARAVGGAVGSNRLAIIIPCHRILPSDGGIGGFAWGAERKKWLLELEKRISKNI